MTCNLVYKELRLAAHPTLFVFSLMGALVLIPAYPYGVVFLFGSLAPFITFTWGRETNDIYYTALLPVKKRDVVRGKMLLVVLVQLFQLAFSVPFAFLRTLYLPQGNLVGIEANVAYYGFGLMIFALFNAVFFPAFFKTGYKVGTAFIPAIALVTVGIIAMEVCVHIPALNWLDSTTPALLLWQLPVLAAGIVVYALALVYAWHKAARRFELVDL